MVVAGLLALGDASLWAGLTSAELTVILDGLGNPTSFLEVAAIPKDVFTDSMNQVRMASPGGDDDAPGIPLTPVAKGKAQQFLRACIAKVGVVSGPPTVTTVAVKGPKMANFVDSSLDSEIIVLTKPHLERLFSNYRSSRGEFPSQEIEPTEEQISAIHQLINTGCSPYVDFAIFGPFGRRLLRKLTFISYHYNAPEGTWKRLELPGPPDFDSWGKSWLVLKCTFLLLGGFKPERLDLYGEHLRSFLTTYGPDCWFLIYQADVRMRSEHFERIRRRLQINFDTGLVEFGFDPTVPWDAVFAAAVKDKEFWDSEIREKALLYLAKVNTYRETTQDGTSQIFGGLPRGPAASLFPNKGQGQKRKFPRQEPSYGGGKRGGPQGQGKGGPQGQGGNKHETCNNWNAGRCQEPCPTNRAHACARCGGNHKKDQCSSSPSGPSKPQGKNKGKNPNGKGK